MASSELVVRTIWYHEQLHYISFVSYALKLITIPTFCPRSPFRFLVDKNAPSQLKYVSRIRSFFDRSFEIDRKKREDILRSMEIDDLYTEDENAIFTEGLTKISAFETIKDKQRVTFIIFFFFGGAHFLVF